MISSEQQRLSAPRIEPWLGERERWSEPWRDAAVDSIYVARLSPEQARALADELTAIIHRYLTGNLGRVRETWKSSSTSFRPANLGLLRARRHMGDQDGLSLLALTGCPPEVTFPDMALIPPFYLDCGVALGKRDADGNAHWTASGFLFGEFERVVSDDVKRYHVYLVTNRHVLRGAAKLLMRFNPEGTDPAREFEGSLLKVEGSPTWYGHPDPQIDVAVLPLTISRFQEMGIRTEWFRSDEHPMPVGLSESPVDGR